MSGSGRRAFDWNSLPADVLQILAAALSADCDHVNGTGIAELAELRLVSKFFDTLLKPVVFSTIRAHSSLASLLRLKDASRSSCGRLITRLAYRVVWSVEEKPSSAEQDELFRDGGFEKTELSLLSAVLNIIENLTAVCILLSSPHDLPRDRIHSTVGRSVDSLVQAAFLRTHTTLEGVSNNPASTQTVFSWDSQPPRRAVLKPITSFAVDSGDGHEGFWDGHDGVYRPPTAENDLSFQWLCFNSFLLTITHLKLHVNLTSPQMGVAGFDMRSLEYLIYLSRQVTFFDLSCGAVQYQTSADTADPDFLQETLPNLQRLRVSGVQFRREDLFKFFANRKDTLEWIWMQDIWFITTQPQEYEWKQMIEDMRNLFFLNERGAPSGKKMRLELENLVRAREGIPPNRDLERDLLELFYRPL